MLKQEFESMLGESVDQKDYEKIETVYMWYPNIDDKDDIVRLYGIGGMVLIMDLLPRAEEIKNIEDQIQRLTVRKNNLLK